MQITTTNVELTIDGFPCRTYVAAPKVELTSILDLSMNTPPPPDGVDFDDMFEFRACGTQNVFAVDKRLPGLLLDRRAGQLVRPRINADDARRINGRTYPDCLTE